MDAGVHQNVFNALRGNRQNIEHVIKALIGYDQVIFLCAGPMKFELRIWEMPENDRSEIIRIFLSISPQFPLDRHVTVPLPAFPIALRSGAPPAPRGLLAAC
jgi:hypothetical protein